MNSRRNRIRYFLTFALISSFSSSGYIINCTEDRKKIVMKRSIGIQEDSDIENSFKNNFIRKKRNNDIKSDDLVFIVNEKDETKNANGIKSDDLASIVNGKNKTKNAYEESICCVLGLEQFFDSPHDANNELVTKIKTKKMENGQTQSRENQILRRFLFLISERLDEKNNKILMECMNYKIPSADSLELRQKLYKAVSFFKSDDNYDDFRLWVSALTSEYSEETSNMMQNFVREMPASKSKIFFYLQHWGPIHRNAISNDIFETSKKNLLQDISSQTLGRLFDIQEKINETIRNILSILSSESKCNELKNIVCKLSLFVKKNNSIVPLQPVGRIKSQSSQRDSNRDLQSDEQQFQFLFPNNSTRVPYDEESFQSFFHSPYDDQF